MEYLYQLIFIVWQGHFAEVLVRPLRVISFRFLPQDFMTESFMRVDCSSGTKVMKQLKHHRRMLYQDAASDHKNDYGFAFNSWSFLHHNALILSSVSFFLFFKLPWNRETKTPKNEKKGNKRAI